MPVIVEPEFKKMVVNLLERANLKQANIEKYTQKKHMISFRTTFYHKSYNSKNNYEVMEFLGDARIDSIIAKYIHRRFPEIKKEGILTKIKHKLKSGKQLGQFGHKLGFFEFARYKPYRADLKRDQGAFPTLVKTHFRHLDPSSITEDMIRENLKDLSSKSKDFLEEYEEYTAFTEDLFEAFIGTVMEVVDSEEIDGISEVVTYNIVTSLLDTVDIKVTREWIGDPVTRLKEMLFDSKDKALGWNINKSMRTLYDASTGMHTTTIVWYPKGDMSATKSNESILATGNAKSKKLSGKRSAAIAIEYLKTTYRYKESPLEIE